MAPQPRAERAFAEHQGAMAELAFEGQLAVLDLLDGQAGEGRGLLGTEQPIGLDRVAGRVDWLGLNKL